MNLSETKIGFIGFGNMAQAITKGWLLAEKVDPKMLYASARDQEKLIENTADLGIHAMPTNEDLVNKVDLVILAVKPYQVRDVIAPLEEKLVGKVLLSVAVNFLYEDFEALLMEGTEHLSSLPNTPVAFADGIFLLEEKHSLSEENFKGIKELLGSISQVEMIPTSEMDIAGIISGSAPAFVDLFTEALADAAVKHGLNRQRAYQLISQMIRGTANLQLKTKKHPGQLKDEITSPSGTTIKGIASLEKDAFRGTLINAVDEILKD